MSGFIIREYREEDRAAVDALGGHVISWWHGSGPGTSLHLVAADSHAVLGYLQATDRSLPEPSRRPGQIHFELTVAPPHRRQDIAGALYERVAQFAAHRRASLLYTVFRDC